MYYGLTVKAKTKDGNIETVFQGNGLTEAVLINTLDKLNPMFGGALLNVTVGQQSDDFIFSENVKKEGKWIKENENFHKCSLCGLEVSDALLSPFCPNCGAEMKEIEG